MVVTLNLRRNMAGEEHVDSKDDLTKYLKPCPRKRRTPRVEIWRQQSPSVSSSETISSSEASVQSSGEDTDGGPQVSSGASTGHVDSEKVIEFADNPGTLKRKSDESGRKTQNTTQGIDVATITTSKEHSTGPEIQIAPKTPKRYECSLCDKVFSSHEALGGHKSSHKKFKMVIINAAEERQKKRLSLTNTSPRQTASDRPEPVLLLGDDGTQHTCKICFKKFPSGQALGGHQRCHWTGNMPHGKTPKIMDFDLNESPEEEDCS